MSQFDVDWVVVGIGVRGVGLRAAPGRKGLLGAACSSAANASATRTSRSRPGTCAATSGRRGSGCKGHLPPHPVQGRRRGQRLRRRRRQPRLRQHALRAATRVLQGPAVGRPRGLGADARPALRRGAADARRRRPVEHDDPADQLLRELGEHLGVGDTYRKTPVGVYLGQPRARPSPTPTSAARARTAPAACSAAAAWSAARTAPRTRWSRTTSGWPSGAASRSSAERTVTDDPPARRRRRLATATRSPASAPASSPAAAAAHAARPRRVVAAGPLGTNKLLQRCRLGGALPRISDRLGELVRTNSEMILAVTVPEDYPDDLTKRVAITSSDLPRRRTPTSRPSPTATPATR